MQTEFSSAALHGGQPTDKGSGRISIEWHVLKKEIAPRGKALMPLVQQQATKA
jgi:hypothetical protein